MTQDVIVRGVPRSIALDGWWLASESVDMPGSGGGGAGDWGRVLGAGRSGGVAGLLLLILVGDILFWGHHLGLSLALFAGAVFAVAVLATKPRRGVLYPAILLLVTVLPIVEHLQLLSLAFLAAGLIASLAWLRIPPGAGWDMLLSGVARLSAAVPVLGVRDSGRALGHVRQVLKARAGRPVVSTTFLRNWAFPVGGTLVLGALLVEANPVMERILSNSLRIDLGLVELAERVFFWLGLALLVWPLLNAPEPSVGAKLALKRPRLGLNSGSVLRALTMFNLLLAVQTLMDASILLGGADLPEGMTYATYAHRGAYPLLTTAVLAGGFVLAARPFLGDHRALKPLLLLWLGQNVLLSLSAALRLELYIDTYGLTYLRIHALIWIGLVAIGLALTGWQILRGRTNGWLLLRGAGLGAATLYACCFVNFAGVIAETNLARWERNDWSYICTLGPTASAGVTRAMAANPWITLPSYAEYCPALRTPIIDGWRDWGFRNWRVSDYLAGETLAERAYESPSRR
ncbi:DUF4153 domain-containing protein [Aliiroseovarius sp. YM-037]|uniref:DUF4153 domain-containing protein n=1 Tax=Aliiroseovarius sp. YM-037 TaxID=3341728 RepID=UPI003A802B5B